MMCANRFQHAILAGVTRATTDDVAAQSLPIPSAPTWWRVTLTLHQGVTVIRNVTIQPDAHQVLECGWFEKAANGDEFAVGYDAIATVAVNGFSGPMPGSTGRAA